MGSRSQSAGYARARAAGGRSGDRGGYFDRQQVVTLRRHEKLSWPEIARKLGVGLGPCREPIMPSTNRRPPASIWLTLDEKPVKRGFRSQVPPTPISVDLVILSGSRFDQRAPMPG